MATEETPRWWNEAAKYIGLAVSAVVLVAGVVSAALLALTDLVPEGVRDELAAAVAVTTAIALGASRIQALLTRDRVYSFATVADAANEAKIDPHAPGGVVE